jgi:hypothetical protein
MTATSSLSNGLAQAGAPPLPSTAEPPNNSTRVLASCSDTMRNRAIVADAQEHSWSMHLGTALLGPQGFDALRSEDPRFPRESGGRSPLNAGKPRRCRETEKDGSRKHDRGIEPLKNATVGANAPCPSELKKRGLEARPDATGKSILTKDLNGFPLQLCSQDLVRRPKTIAPNRHR